MTTLDVHERGAVVVITLNRPHARNAMSMQMRREFGDVLLDLAERTEAGAVVISGSGGNFCAGADVREPDGVGSAILGEPSFRQRTRRTSIYALLRWLPWPSVAAIEGYALGGGLEIALSCDLRVAADDAVLGLPEVSHGTIPAGGGTQLLPRFVGPDLARQMVLMGRRLSGAEALSAGLVSDVVDAGAVMDRAVDVAARLAAQPVDGLRAARYALAVAMDAGLEAGLDYEAQTSALAHFAREHAGTRP